MSYKQHNINGKLKRHSLTLDEDLVKKMRTKLNTSCENISSLVNELLKLELNNRTKVVK